MSGPRLGSQHSERLRVIALTLAPFAGDRHEWCAVQREGTLRFRMFRADELEEARGGNEHLPLLEKSRPSDRKLKTGPPFGPLGTKLKFIGTSSTTLPAARITGAMSLIRTMSAAIGRWVEHRRMIRRRWAGGCPRARHRGRGRRLLRGAASRCPRPGRWR